MGLILGIDQGSTKTAAVIMDSDGNVLGSGRAYGACHAVHGLSHAMAAVTEASRAALRDAGADMLQVKRVSAGMTGADWPQEYTMLRKVLHRATGVAHVLVHNDCIAALRGGTGRQCAAVICSGTGLNIGFRCPNGETWAFGYYIDVDLLGISALKAVFGAEAGVAPATALTEALLEFYGEINVESLLRKYVEAKLPARVNDLAPIVVRIAASGDEAASAITADYARRTAQYVLAGLKRFEMQNLHPDVVLSGSVLKSSHMRDKVASAVGKACPGASVVDALYEPVVGAALLALDEMHGMPLPDVICKNINRSSAAHGLLRLSKTRG